MRWRLWTTVARRRPDRFFGCRGSRHGGLACAGVVERVLDPDALLVQRPGQGARRLLAYSLAMSRRSVVCTGIPGGSAGGAEIEVLARGPRSPVTRPVSLGS